MQTSLPIYHRAVDWKALYRDYPVPDVFHETVYKWPADQIRQMQNARFMECVKRGWENEFYKKRWRAAGLEPGDVRSIDDSHKIPTFTSDDIKKDQEENPPFGLIHGPGLGYLKDRPLKLQTSGGTTGRPRPTLYGPVEWELNGLTLARALYGLGARPGDVFQAPYTAALQNTGWCAYKAAHDYLGVLPITTGTGAVTPSRRQLELAFEWGTNFWYARPEYMTQLAKVCRDELGRDLKELGTKFVCGGFGPDVDSSFRDQIEELWGCPAYDLYGTHEMGMGSFECSHKAGMHLMEDTIYIELVDVEDQNSPIADGEKGDMVVTIFFRSIPPIIRYNLRDLTRIIGTGVCECGSSFRRMEKCLGRSDTMVRIRGNSIWPQACLPAIKSDPRTTGEWLCVAERINRDGVVREEMTVKVEVADSADRGGLQEQLEQRLRTDLGVKVAVELVGDGALIEYSNRGVEGKPRRILDLRYEKQ